MPELRVLPRHTILRRITYRRRSLSLFFVGVLMFAGVKPDVLGIATDPFVVQSLISSLGVHATTLDAVMNTADTTREFNTFQRSNVGFARSGRLDFRSLLSRGVPFSVLPRRCSAQRCTPSSVSVRNLLRRHGFHHVLGCCDGRDRVVRWGCRCSLLESSDCEPVGELNVASRRRDFGHDPKGVHTIFVLVERDGGE